MAIMAVAFSCAGCAQDELPPLTLSDLIAAAERGDADAQYRLGDMYRYDLVPGDYAEAVQWYHAAGGAGPRRRPIPTGTIHLEWCLGLRDG